MTPIFDINELIALMRAGTSEEAIPHLEHITQKLPTHVAAHALLAQAYTNERRLEEARVAWQNALFLMPNSPSIKKGFRRVLKELSKHQPLPPVPEAEPAPELQEEQVAETQEERSPEAIEEPTPPQEEAAPEQLEEPVLEAQEEAAPETTEEPEIEATEEPVLEAQEEPVSEEVPSLEAQEEEDLTESEVEEEEELETIDTFYIPNTNRVDTEESNDGEADKEARETSVGEQESPSDENETGVDTEEAEEETEPALVAEEENQGILHDKLDIDLEELLDGAPSHSDETPSMLINPSSHHNATPIEIEAIKAQAPQEEMDESDEEDEEEPIPTNDIPLPIITVPTPSSSSANTPPPDSKGLPPDIPVPPILAPLVENTEEWEEDQELDNLIQELESARIVPKPDHEHIEVPVLEDDIEDMVSETLARIFEGQKQYSKAADMYEKLAVLHPERAKKFEAKATELRDLKNNNPE
ncbi:MAG: tetratricopeptide repeat protein [Rhodothermaceae bacterium]|nr:tetratricopeptide repeat protein [Rhodothermaceae bacterium]